MAEYKGTVELIAGITPKNGGGFPLVGAHDVQIDDEGNRLDTEFGSLKSALANEYDISSTYKVNDLVFYNGKLYRCFSEITTPEPWTASHWTSANANVNYIVNKKFEGLNERVTSIANEYDISSTYKVNDLVFYNGKVYRCVSEITTPEPWTGSHWTSANADVNYAINKKFEGLNERVTNTESISNNMVGAVFTNNFKTQLLASSISISWTRLYVQTNGGAISFDDSSTYTLSNSSPVLCIRNNSVIVLGTISDIRPTDVVLLVYRDGKITDGLLFPTYADEKFATYKAYFADGFQVERHKDIVIVKWSRLYIKTSHDAYDFATGVYKLSNNAPVLVIRNEEIVTLGTYSDIRPSDMILLNARGGVISGGLIAQYCTDLITTDTYEDDAHFNVIRNNRQMANLRWIPKKPVKDGDGTHQAGVEIKGVPYSSVKEYLKYVGIDVSLHTFMTAVNDEHSLLYSECPDKVESRSAYGITYNGTNSYSYFGSVCSGFVCTAIGSLVQYNSWEYQTFPQFERLSNQDIENLKVGDVLSYDGHCAVISAISRSNGSASFIELDEHAAPIAMTRGHTINTLKKRAIENGGVWCRYKALDKNTKYAPSPFVLSDTEYLYEIGDFCFIDGTSRTYYRCTVANSDSEWNSTHWAEIEKYSAKQYSAGAFVSFGDHLYECIKSNNVESFAQEYWYEIKNIYEWAAYPYNYNNDIVTFAGDRAVFHTNDLIYLNYAKGNYTKIELYKNGNLSARLDLEDDGYQINISSRCSEPGVYKARLTNLTDYSRFTYFEVLDTTVSATFDGNTVEMSFSSTNGIPLEWQIVEESGSTICHMPFSDYQLRKGHVSVSPVAKMYVEKHLYDNRWTAYNGTPIYARVVFGGEYGNTVNPMIYLGTLSSDYGKIIYPNEITTIDISNDEKIYLADSTDGNVYTFTLNPSEDSAIRIIPSIGHIKWTNEVPTLDAQHSYLVSITNGVGSIIQN